MEEPVDLLTTDGEMLRLLLQKVERMEARTLSTSELKQVGSEGAAPLGKHASMKTSSSHVLKFAYPALTMLSTHACMTACTRTLAHARTQNVNIYPHAREHGGTDGQAGG